MNSVPSIQTHSISIMDQSIRSKYKVDFYQNRKVDKRHMDECNDSDQFSFWSHQASQGSCKNTNQRTRTLQPLQLSQKQTKCSQYALTKTSSKNVRKREAGIRSREKKKNYVKTLEENVKRLDMEIQEVDQEICSCKDQLLQALKTSNNTPNQHAFTFAELQRNAHSEDPDLDRINLLIDLISVRTGANGKERQAKLDYNFKQLVNCIFPASYRYLLNIAVSSRDVFSSNATSSTLISDPNSWHYEMYLSVGMDDHQVNALKAFRESLCKQREEAITHTIRLKNANEAIKRQGEVFQKKIVDFREDMNAIQCAKTIIFAQKNRLRKEFAFCGDLESEPKLAKRIKTQ